MAAWTTSRRLLSCVSSFFLVFPLFHLQLRVASTNGPVCWVQTCPARLYCTSSGMKIGESAFSRPIAYLPMRLPYIRTWAGMIFLTIPRSQDTSMAGLLFRWIVFPDLWISQRGYVSMRREEVPHNQAPFQETTRNERPGLESHRPRLIQVWIFGGLRSRG
ncbi:hypothetical protein BDP81DRAFT_305 [Colletotrichum phormii]|uniref:Secreted protein n=1 Tax=Colletotrichum phormii TaxID=359342 RepID=A0AAJ0EN24_9PEZI|nr:uncharacterized protein BDP81DRAFT_305 [Colletotrichum phormii]KAK1655174.1 hypothetical protein BDP81DRAFT_305 [Colletotrichum phormii]